MVKVLIASSPSPTPSSVTPTERLGQSKTAIRSFSWGGKDQRDYPRRHLSLSLQPHLPPALFRAQPAAFLCRSSFPGVTDYSKRCNMRKFPTNCRKGGGRGETELLNRGKDELRKRNLWKKNNRKINNIFWDTLMKNNGSNKNWIYSQIP